jgi:hypothetical protein
MFQCWDGNLSICLPRRYAGEVLVSPLLPRFDEGLLGREVSLCIVHHDNAGWKLWMMPIRQKS